MSSGVNISAIQIPSRVDEMEVEVVRSVFINCTVRAHERNTLLSYSTDVYEWRLQHLQLVGRS